MIIFSHAGQALGWSTEILRAYQHAPNAAFYKEALIPRTEIGWENDEELPGSLPTDMEEKRLLAIALQNAIQELPLSKQQLIRLRYWGDYVNEQTLMKAVKFQQLARQRGQRVRLNYRYSLSQLALIMSESERRLQRQLDDAHAAIAQVYEKQGYLVSESEIRQKNSLSRTNSVDNN